MDANPKKMALRMIPYGLFVRTGESDGRVAAVLEDARSGASPGSRIPGESPE